MPHKEEYQEIVAAQESLTRDSLTYWTAHSGFDTWQFWVIAGILIVPLWIAYRFMKRDIIFQIGFYGFAVHVLFAYIDTAGIRLGLWGYPYQLIPTLPSLSLDASIIPVSIMLVYQWTVVRAKNFHLYALATAAVFGFGVKPLLTAIGLFEPYQWVNYFHVFLIYIVLYEAAYWLTKLFLKLRDNAASSERSVIRARRRSTS